MNIVVTGASGLVGANIIRNLLEYGENVTALVHRDKRALEGLSIRSLTGDIEDSISLQHAFRDADAVVHSAGFVSIRRNEWKKVYRLNVQATRNVAQACLASGVKKLVYISSVHAQQQHPLNIPLDETRPLVKGKSFSPYDRSKAMAEMALTAYATKGLHAIILRPTAVIGPHDYRPSALGKSVYLLSRGRWPAVVTGGFDWVDARDVGKAVKLALQYAPANSQYLISGTWTSVLELARRISSITHCFCPKIAFPLWLAECATPLGDLAASISTSEQVFTSVSMDALRSNPVILHQKAEKELGYTPRPLDETLHDTIAWFQKHIPTM